MEIYLEKQLINIVYSLILGLIFGGIYDIIRIIHILFGIASYSGEKKGMRCGKLPFFLFLFLDAVYVLTVTAVYSVFNYFACNGEFRVFILAAVCAGFAIYYVTFGRIVMFFSEVLVAFLGRVFHYVIVVPMSFMLKMAVGITKFTYGITLGRLVKRIARCVAVWRTDRYRRMIGRDIVFNFVESEGAK